MFINLRTRRGSIPYKNQLLLREKLKAIVKDVKEMMYNTEGIVTRWQMSNAPFAYFGALDFLADKSAGLNGCKETKKALMMENRSFSKRLVCDNVFIT